MSSRWRACWFGHAVLAAAASSCALGCSKSAAPPTQVIVLVNAEPEVRAATADVRLSVRDDDAQDALDETVAPDWPIKLTLVPRGGDASRTYVVTAEALDDGGAVRARARLASGYVAAERRFVVLLLEAACLGVTCKRADQTCHAGRCTLAQVQPDQLGKVQSEAPEVGTLLDIPLPDAGTAGTGMDGGESGASGAGGAGGEGGKAGRSGGRAGAGGGAGMRGEAGGDASDPCENDNGGCDPQVDCSSDGASVTCGECPGGYDDANGDGTQCVDSDACAGSPVCTADFPCRDLPAPSLDYTCRGQYAEWAPSDAPASFVTNTDGTVTDTRSQLVWQENVDSGTYSWEAAQSYCEDLTLAGRSDWRLPARAELESLIDFGRFESAIDPDVFPGTPDDWFWTSSPYVGEAGNAWSIVFDNGNSFYTLTTRASRVRCVRGVDPVSASTGGGGAPPGRFAVRSNGTVDDTRTQLTWQRVASGESFTQAEAVSFCEELSLAGSSDWRLPAISELLTLVDPTRSQPAIDALAFPGTPNEIFWSATRHATAASEAWNIYFFYGYSSSNDAATAARARCVR